MADLKQFPPAVRIRCKSGEGAGQWLSSMGVSKGGHTVGVPNWLGILRNVTGHTFHPKYVPVESSAFKFISLDVAAGQLDILKGMGIDAEIVEIPSEGK